jgi:ketosteroid isomerase-like protein
MLRPLALTLLAAAILAAAPPLRAADDPLASLVDAERAFARETAKVGIRAGFLAWFARDAIDVGKTVGNAWDRISSRPAPPNPTAAHLEWEPRVGDVAASGDLGWLTGPSTFIPPDGSKHYGNYLSVWKQTPDGWRVYIDVGAEAPSPVPFEPGFVRMPAREGRYDAAAHPGDSDEVALRSLAQAGRTADSADGFVAAFADEGRYHRPGALPLLGRAAIAADATAHPAAVARATEREVVARAHDLGYSYGRYGPKANLAGAKPGNLGETGSETGSFVRVWRRTRGGTWQIVAQVNQPDRQ